MEAATITARFMADTSGLIQGAQQASQSLQQVATAQTDMGKSAVSATAGVKALGMAMKALIATAVISFFRSAINSFEESERASRKLASALKNNASVAQTSQAEWEELSSDIQDYSRFSDEAATSTIALYANMGLTEDQVRTLLPLTADLAEKLGVDMESAALKVTRAMSGSARSLQMAGINMTGLTEAADKTTFVMERLDQQVGGFAETARNDASVQLAQLANEFDDFKENLGSAVLPVLTAIVSKGLKPLAEVLQNIPRPALMVGAALAGVGAALKVAQGVAPTVAGAFRTMGSFLGRLVPGMSAFGAETEVAAEANTTLSDTVTNANTSIQSNLARLSIARQEQLALAAATSGTTTAIAANTTETAANTLAVDGLVASQTRGGIVMGKTAVAAESQAVSMGVASTATTGLATAGAGATTAMTMLSRALGVIGVAVGLATAAWTIWNMATGKQNDELKEAEERIRTYRDQLRGLAGEAADIANAQSRFNLAVRESEQRTRANAIAIQSVFTQLRSGVAGMESVDAMEMLGLDDPTQLRSALEAFREGFNPAEIEGLYSGVRRVWLATGDAGKDLVSTLNEMNGPMAQVTSLTDAQYLALGKLSEQYKTLLANEMDVYFFDVAKGLKTLNTAFFDTGKAGDRAAQMLSAAQAKLRQFQQSAVGTGVSAFFGFDVDAAVAEGLAGFSEVQMAQASLQDALTAQQAEDYGFFGLEEGDFEGMAKAVDTFHKDVTDSMASLAETTDQNVQEMISSWHQWRDQTQEAFSGVDMALGEFVGKTKVNLDNVIESQERVITLQKNFTEDLLEVAETAPKAFIDWAREQGLAVAGLIGSLADAGRGQRQEFFENWRKQQGLGKGITDVFQEALVGTTRAIRDLIRAIKGIPEWEAIPRNIKSADDFNRRLDIMKRKMVDQSGMELNPKLADKAVEGLAAAMAGADETREATDRANEAAERLGDSIGTMPGLPEKLSSSMEVFAGVSDSAATAVQTVADALRDVPETVNTSYNLSFAVRGEPPPGWEWDKYNGIGHTGGLMTDKGFKRMHWGGLASDERPAILQVGEFVMQRKAVDRYGEDFFQALNRGLPSMSTNQGPTPIRLDLRVEPIIDRDRIAREHTRAVTYTGL